MNNGYFSEYLQYINNILDKKHYISKRLFANMVGDSQVVYGSNTEIISVNRNELQNLFGIANGCKNKPTIGTHPDFIYLKQGDLKYQYCVSMFIDIKGSTNLALKYSLEEVRQMKDAVLSLCIHTVTIFGGHIQRLQGDGLYIQYTNNNVYKNDMIINALNTASILCHFISTTLSDCLKSRNLEPLRIKVGIDYGDERDVLWSHYGIVGCNELTATSIHVDLAAKLQARAKSNEIRIGQNVKEELDIPEEYIAIPEDKNGVEEKSIKSIMNYRQYIFKWESYLRIFDFVRGSSHKSGELEIYKPSFRLVCNVKKEIGNDMRYSQNISSLEKSLQLEYSLFYNDNIYHKKPYETITWMIHNRGVEAEKADSLKFEQDSYKNESIMQINTEYLGHHYVECIIDRGLHSPNVRVKFGIYVR